MNYSPSTPPPSPPPVPKETNYTPWLIGCGVVFLLFIIAMIGFSVYLFSGDFEGSFSEMMEEPGIKMSNELDQKTLDWMKEKKLLNDSEKLITYYDHWMDKMVVSILTTERLLFYKNGRVTSIPLAEIKEVKRYKQEDVFDGAKEVFVIISQSGERMKIEMMEFEGADLFERELNDARKEK